MKSTFVGRIGSVVDTFASRLAYFRAALLHISSTSGEVSPPFFVKNFRPLRV